MITEKNFQTGGSLNGKQQPNSHQKVQYLTIMCIILEMKMVEYNHANLNNGLTLYNQLILILQEEILWVTSLFLQNKL